MAAFRQTRKLWPTDAPPPADLTDETWLRSVRALLASAPSIEVVEGIEATLKARWYDLLQASDWRPEVTEPFSATFNSIGMLVKQKPYGIKYAAPFGYSIFVLRPGMGFSVQLHRTAKVEAFHILECDSAAFAMVADKRTWDRVGKAFIADWSRGILREGELGFRPKGGDVLVISELGVVHTILGCVLEEYATTSNDAVVRLYDQNEHREAVLGDAPPLREVLLALRTSPRNRVQHTGRGWEREAIPESDVTEIVDLPEQGLRGEHIHLRRRGSLQTFGPDPESVVTLFCLAGEATVELGDRRFCLGTGDTIPVAPRQAFAVESQTESTRLAVSRVRVDLAFADLRSTQS